MIFVYTGKTGSGKTWKMVHDAYKEWKRGVDIYSNIPLFFKDRKYKIDRVGEIHYYESIIELLDVSDGIILMDEAQVLMNARNWENLPYEFQWKLQQHRKHKLDLFATTQNMGTIDIAMRRLVQQWKHCYPVFWIMHEWHEKDIDELYNSVDDLKVTTVRSGYYLTHPLWKPALYDTYFDLGFKRFKRVCLKFWDEKIRRMKKKLYIIPRNMTLKDAQKQISLLEFTLNPKTKTNSRRS